HLTHIADVDLLARIRGIRPAHGHLPGPDQVAVLAGQADRATALAVDQIDDFLVDRAAEHHLHHVHGLGIGHPHAGDEAALLADPLQQLADLRPAAVHHHRIHADQLHQHDVAREAVLEVLLGHGVAAVLDDHGLAAETLDIGQR